MDGKGHGLLLLYINRDGGVSASSQASWKVREGRLVPPEDAEKERVRLVLSKIPADELRRGHFSYQVRTSIDPCQSQIQKPLK